ncbi:Transposable element tcb2 transposase [Caligus rogercresseyi]|uniref:Transposable element tcb2 transposase n=1 Tax=Caligus rogercresseyi TaxID=217165 RepID=A0A7T8HMY7_CALRO|nr:Transposable element tcb2 transposase [Caligus rogercresseyi]
MKRTRETIVELVRARHGAKAIKDITGYASSTVYDVVKAFGDIWDQEKDADLLSRLKAIGKGKSRNPDVSLGQKAQREQGYRLQGRQGAQHHVLQAQPGPFVDREDEGGQIEEVQKDVEFVEFFSDEKIFTLDRSSNRQNDKWLAKTKKEVPKSLRMKNLASVMVLGAVSTAGDAGEKINIDVYLGVLKEIVKPWMDEKASKDQDFASAHKPNKSQEWLQAYGELERHVCTPSHATVTSLKASIKRQASKFPAADVTAVCKAFWSRIEAVIGAEDGHIE